ncbi:creatininase family protein [uncultured Sphaerochaeta sp.]|uniref:creatininase family protein n=1 Tax=uncultured Sphaerochaeta sp. TaxID=886478 RepID=UPI002A0A4333|nr:creatininase family protein [uncultured Sphaerochaeta sp.]
MKNSVLYEELFPLEFTKRLGEHPIGYLPLGTLEWHGLQNALGSDLIQARDLFEAAARKFGGIVFPPLFIGPDSIGLDSTGQPLMGMDKAKETQPNQQLTGSCYWVSKGLFTMVVEAILAQAKRAGFRCIVADGHGPSRKVWNEMADTWEKQFDIVLVSALRDFSPGTWKTQMDHAGKNETSLMLALHPELVALERLSQNPEEWPLGVRGEDPRTSTPEYGQELLSSTLDALGNKLTELGML